MIINVGGRTDIINYYTPWLLNRINEGFVYSRNPLFKNQVSKIDLNPNKVDCLLLCSKNYKPILEYIKEINEKYRIICHYTITPYGKDIEPNVPNIDESIDTLIKLSNIVGREKIIWRYDPLLLTKNYSIECLINSYEYIASRISNYISRSIFSFVELNKRIENNIPDIIYFTEDDKLKLVREIGVISKKYNIYVQSCGTDESYEKYGIHKSGCTTKEILEHANNVNYKKLKDAHMRKGCHCIQSRDIGSYNTCLNRCKYCYANKKLDEVNKNFKLHNINSPILIGNITKDDKITCADQKSFII